MCLLRTDRIWILLRPPQSLSPALAGLDSNRGMLRWHIHYNLLVLRMLSYGSDLHWARIQRREDGSRATSRRGPPDVAKARVAKHLPSASYNLAAFVAYALYPPLYIAGPIMTFNSFASQLSSPTPTSPRRVLQYALRWGAALLSLEVLTHTLYFNCIAKYRAWAPLEQMGVALSPLHYAEGSYWVLVFMWLKVSAWE